MQKVLLPPSCETAEKLSFMSSKEEALFLASIQKAGSTGGLKTRSSQHATYFCKKWKASFWTKKLDNGYFSKSRVNSFVVSSGRRSSCRSITFSYVHIGKHFC